MDPIVRQSFIGMYMDNTYMTTIHIVILPLIYFLIIIISVTCAFLILLPLHINLQKRKKKMEKMVMTTEE